jgi:hypothetical protein
MINGRDNVQEEGTMQWENDSFMWLGRPQREEDSREGT